MTEESSLFEKHDLKNIAIILGVALVIGIYLIATTVVISKDGVFYIERAQQFTSDPVKIIKAHPPGYPFLILAAHKVVSLFTDSTSNQTWIYSAQSVTLLCRLLALIPLYFIGKLLVDSKNSFWAIFILIILPNSAKYCAEVLRAWPYILFLAMGFFFLLWGVKCRKWWAFGLVGLSSGLGYMIRPESIQLILYAFIWLALCMFWSKFWNVSRAKNFIAIFLLLFGFAVSAGLYMKHTNQIVPQKFKNFYDMNFTANQSVNPLQSEIEDIGSVCRAGVNLSGGVLDGPYAIFKSMGEITLWFFLPVLLIGLCIRFRFEMDFQEKYLILCMISINITMLLLRYYMVESHISQRWCLPLLVLTIFYIPAGLEIIAKKLNIKCPRKLSNPKFSSAASPWYLLLCTIGIVICMPKLFRPIGCFKKEYRDVSSWLNENTGKNDYIIVPDKRISFYAERIGHLDSNVSKDADYVVMLVKDDEPHMKTDRALLKRYSLFFKYDKEKRKKIEIYEVL